MPDIVEEVEADQPKAVNVAARFKFSDVEVVKYLTNKKWIDFKRDKDRPITKTIKAVFFADKNSGKSHDVCTIAELDKRNPKLVLAEFGHVKFLLDENHILPGNPLIVADLEGKFDNLRIKGKFKGYPIRSVDIWHPDGPMPNMGNPVELYREVRLFLAAGLWAHNNPVQYKQMTIAEGIEGGLDAPNAMALENYTIFTTEIMNYARVVAHPENIKELEARGQELGAPIIPKFDNWSIRDGNWDFIGGFTQRLPMHYVATCRQRQKWVGGAPTDVDDVAQYKMAKYAFNVVVHLWKERDPATDKIKFWGQIIESDFMDEGIRLPPFENPCFLKVVSEITKYSHAEILDKYGTWKESPEGGMIWVKNKVEKPAPATTSNVIPQNRASKPPTVAPRVNDVELVSSGVPAMNEKAEAKPVEPQKPAEPRPSIAAIKKVIADVNMKTATAKPAMKPVKPRVAKPLAPAIPKVTVDKDVVPGSLVVVVEGSPATPEQTEKQLAEFKARLHGKVEVAQEVEHGTLVEDVKTGETVAITSTEGVKEVAVEKVLEEVHEAEKQAEVEKT